MRRKALIVGVDRYSSGKFVNLEGAKRDANNMYAFLTRGLPYGYRFDAKYLSDADATASNVMNVLTRMIEELTEDSIFVFYFAGHGTCLHGSDRQSLLCSDASPLLFEGAEGAGEITPKTLTAFSRTTPGDKFFCFDVCRSQLRSGRGGAEIATGGRGLRRDMTDRKPGVVVGRRWALSSCADGETASDDGAFANALIDAMDDALRHRAELKLGEELVNSVVARMGGSSQRPVADGEPFVLAPGLGKAVDRSVDEIEASRRRIAELERQKTSQQTTRVAGARKVVTISGVEVPFRWAPPGRFMMGSPEGEEERRNGETQHEVILTRGFWLAETETTQELWKAVMGSNPSRFTGDDLLPVECVSWDDCQKFIRKLNGLKVSGAGTFRLPTEAEWEYACRAGATTAFPWGNVLNGDKANCDGRYPYGTEEKGKYLDKTTRVGSYESNAWELYDMNGNVWEWCQDWYGAYPSGTQTDPQGATSGSLRVLRGGSWSLDPGNCRSACRNRSDPACRISSIGFRLAMTGESALS